MTNQTINKNEIKKNNMSYTPDVSMFPYFKKSSIDWKKMYQKTFAQKKALKKENQELKEEIEDIKEEYFEKGWETGKCDTFDEIDETVKPLKEKIEELNEVNDQLEAEAERTGELESIVWIDFYGEKEVIDDIKAYRFRDDIIAMKKENKEYKEYYDKWSEILTDIDGDEFCDLLSDYGWEYNDEDELVNICVDYENDEVDYYIDAGRKVVLKDGRIVKRQD